MSTQEYIIMDQMKDLISRSYTHTHTHCFAQSKKTIGKAYVDVLKPPLYIKCLVFRLHVMVFAGFGICVR